MKLTDRYHIDYLVKTYSNKKILLIRIYTFASLGLNNEDKRIIEIGVPPIKI